VKNNHLGFEEILNYNMDHAHTPDNVTMSLSWHCVVHNGTSSYYILFLN